MRIHTVALLAAVSLLAGCSKVQVYQSANFVPINDGVKPEDVLAKCVKKVENGIANYDSCPAASLASTYYSVPEFEATEHPQSHAPHTVEVKQVDVDATFDGSAVSVGGEGRYLVAQIVTGEHSVKPQPLQTLSEKIDLYQRCVGSDVDGEMVVTKVYMGCRSKMSSVKLEESKWKFLALGARASRSFNRGSFDEDGESCGSPLPVAVKVQSFADICKGMRTSLANDFVRFYERVSAEADSKSREISYRDKTIKALKDDIAVLQSDIKKRSEDNREAKVSMERNIEKAKLEVTQCEKENADLKANFDDLQEKYNAITVDSSREEVMEHVDDVISRVTREHSDAIAELYEKVIKAKNEQISFMSKYLDKTSLYADDESVAMGYGTGH
jgi:hypothetical protein